MLSKNLDASIDDALDAIERNDKSYQQNLALALQEIISNPNAGEVIEPKDLRSYLKKLSAEACAD